MNGDHRPSDKESVDAVENPASGNGFNTYLIHEYILSRNIDRYGGEMCPGCPGNLWPHSYAEVNRALHILEGTSLRHFREGLSFGLMAPESDDPVAAYIQDALEVLRIYADIDATVVLTFGKPIPGWMVYDNVGAPNRRQIADGWCPVPSSDIDWAVVRKRMSSAIASIVTSLYAASDERLRIWMSTRLLIEPFNEFDEEPHWTMAGGCRSAMAPHEGVPPDEWLARVRDWRRSTGRRAYDFTMDVRTLLDSTLRGRGLTNERPKVIMSSGVSGDPEYMRGYFDAGGDGPVNVHLYPTYEPDSPGGVLLSSDDPAAVALYKKRVLDALEAIRAVVPPAARTGMILGEFGLWERRAGVCGDSGSDIARVLFGQARQRFLVEMFDDAALKQYTSMRLKWMYLDGGYSNRSDDLASSLKATGCNLTNGALTKSGDPKPELYEYLHEVDRKPWAEMPSSSVWKEYAGASDALKHQIGQADAGNRSWAVTVNDGRGYMSFGPYVSNLPIGATNVVFDLAIDDNSADDAHVLTLDVYDATTQKTLESRSYTRRQMGPPHQVKEVALPLPISGLESHAFEFRVYVTGVSYVRLDRIRVIAPASSRTARWDGAWGPCLPLCENGTRSRALACVTADGTRVDESLCGPKPVEEEACASACTEYRANQDLSHEIQGVPDGDAYVAPVGARGFAIYGPYVTLPPSTGGAIFDITQLDTYDGTEPMVLLDVYDASRRVPLEAKILDASHLETNRVLEAYLPFSVVGLESSQIEFRVYVYGKARMKINRVRVAQTREAGAMTCQTPWGEILADGATVTAYLSSTVPYGSTCEAFTRMCHEGELTGNSAATSASCAVEPAASCRLPWGDTLPHGSSVPAFDAPSVPLGATCRQLTRTCTHGALGGDEAFSHPSCVGDALAPCSTPWGPSLCVEIKGNDARLHHHIGRAEGAAWSVIDRDGTGHMTYGPYASVALSATGVLFDLVVDDNTANNDLIAAVDVFDFAHDQVHASRTFTRREMAGPAQVKTFAIPFALPQNVPDNRMEFRVVVYGKTYLRLDRIRVALPAN